jgi:hypothetical protein
MSVPMWWLPHRGERGRLTAARWKEQRDLVTAGRGIMPGSDVGVSGTDMCSARGLEGMALLIVVAAALPACRDGSIPPPYVPDDALGSGGGMDSGALDGNRLSPQAPGQPSDARLDDRPAMNADAGEACGAPGQSCCPGNRCGAGCCVGALCAAPFDPCPGVPASCRTTTCGGLCGGLMEPCCGETGYCARELTVCRRTDAGARCEPCGNTGDLCCAGSYCQPPGRRCVNNRCAAM